MLSHRSLTLNEQHKLKSVFKSYVFKKVHSTLQTSKTNNKRYIGTFTLKERSKVTSDASKRFASYFFPKG